LELDDSVWHPENPVRHRPPAVRWPTAEEAAASRLFAPLCAGRLELRHRTWVPAMVPWRATEEGFVTDAVLAWYERFARGRPGAIVVEATGVRDIPSGPLLRIGHDRFTPGLARLVDVVRRASGGRTKLFIQIIDFLAIRRRPEREKFLGRFLTITDAHRLAYRERALAAAAALSAPGRQGSADAAAAESATDQDVRAWLASLDDEGLEGVLDPRELESLRFGYRERVTDVHLPHIAELPRVLPGIFAAAARRAEAAGFDGVELHYAHAYTMASFLSAANTRPDGYGGSRQGRIRLPLEVFHAVRGAVGDGFVVGCRYLADEIVRGGSTVEDASYFGVAFARAGVDFLSLSRGGKFEDAKQPQVGWAAYPYTGPSGWECMPTQLADARGPYGRNADAARQIRDAVRAAGLNTPVVLAGGIHGFDQAEGLLETGAADIIGAARQSLADPDWFEKMRMGRGGEVRRCEFTNYCEGLDQKHKVVTCKLWDRVGLDEPGVTLTSDGRRRTTAPAWDPEPPCE
jgi:2,4-dienoyl-CoA reductase-like NADH-dependent reductase (Old Yellow Enzyme family)